MKKHQALLDHENRWQTTLGAWFPEEGKVVLRGKDLFTDFRDTNWMGLFLYAITGRMFEPKAIRLFEEIWKIGISYPEPRLWGNRVAALAGTVRSTAGLGMSSGLTATEAVVIGGRANIRAIDFFIRTRHEVEAYPKKVGELSDHELTAILKPLIRREMKQHRGIDGFGRPYGSPNDERIVPMMEMIRELGLENGYCLQTAFAIEKVLQGLYTRLNLSMNMTGIAAALAADQGLTARQYYAYVTMGFTAGIVPCYLDALEKPEGCFFPLRCNRVHHEGEKVRRKWHEHAANEIQ